jgi:hypothetical protein
LKLVQASFAWPLPACDLVQQGVCVRGNAVAAPGDDMVWSHDDNVGPELACRARCAVTMDSQRHAAGRGSNCQGSGVSGIGRDYRKAGPGKVEGRYAYHAADSAQAELYGRRQANRTSAGDQHLCRERRAAGRAGPMAAHSGSAVAWKYASRRPSGVLRQSVTARLWYGRGTPDRTSCASIRCDTATAAPASMIS